MSDTLEQFEARWLSRLNDGARATLHFETHSNSAGLHFAIADEFVSRHGYKSIGFNWELLDAQSDKNAPRSAMAQITQALAQDIANPSKPWLDEKDAQECAGQFLAGFEPSELTVVSNRYDGLWNPIAGVEVEWGFVCFDETNIALLLITAK